MRKKYDDYEEEYQPMEYKEKPPKDPILKKLNWLILLFIPQALFFLWLLLSPLILFLEGLF